MSKKEELLAKRDEVRAGKKEACSGIIEALGMHDNEAEKKHTATLFRLVEEEKAIMSELKELEQEK